MYPFNPAPLGVREPGPVLQKEASAIRASLHKNLLIRLIRLHGLIASRHDGGDGSSTSASQAQIHGHRKGAGGEPPQSGKSSRRAQIHPLPPHGAASGSLSRQSGESARRAACRHGAERRARARLPSARSAAGGWGSL